MRQELKKFPKELQEAYKKVPNRPNQDTPAVVMSFMNEDPQVFIKNYTDMYMVNQIIDWVDESLLDLELDEKSPNIYQEFSLEVVKKIMGLIDVDTNKSKDLSFYDNNPKIKKLKMRDFTKLGDLREKSEFEKADILAEFYGIETDVNYLALTEWEKRLFVDKAISRQDTALEKN